MNILLVDDDLLVTTALKIILESDPELHIVDTASSGKEAIALFEKHLPFALPSASATPWLYPDW